MMDRTFHLLIDGGHLGYDCRKPLCSAPLMTRPIPFGPRTFQHRQTSIPCSTFSILGRTAFAGGVDG